MLKRTNNPLRKSNRGFRTFLDPNNQDLTCARFKNRGKANKNGNHQNSLIDS